MFLVSQSCLILRDPMDCNPPGSSVHWILQARYWSVAVPCSGGSAQPRDGTCVSAYPALLEDSLPAAASASLQSCPTLCDPIDFSPPGSSVPGIFQVRVLKWGAIASPVYLLSLLLWLTFQPCYFPRGRVTQSKVFCVPGVCSI